MKTAPTSRVWRLRPASAADCRLLWLWANDPATRAMAYHSKAVPWESHQRWFAIKLQSPATRIYILEDAESLMALGQIRFDEDNHRSGCFTIDIGTAPDHRGTGVGRKLLTLGEEALCKERRVSYLRAEVKSENAASLALFQRNGYTRAGTTAGPGGQQAALFEKIMNPATSSFPAIPLSGGKFIGAGRTFLIAEVASNHARSLDLALEHIAAAAIAGADAVKFQSIDLNELYHQPSESTRDLHGKIDLPEEWHAPLKQCCDKHGVIFLSSPTYLRAIDVQESVGVELYKLASAQISVFPQLVQRVAELGKPAILSTGLVTEDEIDRVVRIFHRAGNDNFIVLHCNSVYPAPAEIVHLPRMLVYQCRFGCRVGFSDHTVSNTAAIAAVAMGACVIERHFTISHRIDSPDAAISLEPQEFTAFTEAVREIEVICQASPRVELEPAESRFKSKIRHTLLAMQDIPAGTKISSCMVSLKRGNPAPGIDAWTVFESPRNCHSARPIAAGSWLTLDDISCD